MRIISWIKVVSLTPEPYSDTVEFWSPKMQGVHKGHFVIEDTFFSYDDGYYHHDVVIWRKIKRNTEK